MMDWDKLKTFHFAAETGSRRAAELMPDGGSLITLTFQGSNRVMTRGRVSGCPAR